MNEYDTGTIIREVIDAHGGAALWQDLEAIDATISASGFLFTAKRRSVLEGVHVRADTKEARFTFYEYPIAGRKSELLGNDEVRIVDESDTVFIGRKDPRSFFRGLRRFFKWDDLDFIYFAGYATWNYLVTPFLFLREGFQFEVLKETLVPGGVSLKATFPTDIPSHCSEQVFHFDEQRLLHRLDYTAEVVGSWARAAHVCEKYKVFDGLAVPTRRRVYPRMLRNRPSRYPVLVAIDVHDIRLRGSR